MDNPTSKNPATDKDELVEQYNDLMKRCKEMQAGLESLKEEGDSLYLQINKAVDKHKRKKIRDYMSKLPDN